MRFLNLQLFRICCMTFFFILLTSVLSPLAHTAEVTVAWNANQESDLAGYNLYYGTSSGVYNHSIDVGLVTQYTITNIDDTSTYYFAATAYDLEGNESILSSKRMSASLQLA